MPSREERPRSCRGRRRRTCCARPSRAPAPRSCPSTRPVPSQEVDMTRAEPKAPLKPKGRTKAAKGAPPAEAPSTPAAVAPRKGSAEITALVHLAEVDVAIEGDPEAKPAARGRASDERKRLGTRLSRELHDAYELARRAG